MKRSKRWSQDEPEQDMTYSYLVVLGQVIIDGSPLDVVKEYIILSN